MKVAAAIAEILKREGVEFIVGYPVNPVIEAAAEADIRTIIVRQERTGLHMADAVSRVTSGDQLGVFVMQHGPGTENAYGGIAQAFSESIPILVLPAGYPRRQANVFPNFNATLNFQHITKSCEPLTMGKALPEVMRRAFSQLRNGRGGPVMVELPLDVFNDEVPDPLDYRRAIETTTAPDPQAVTEVARVLAEARRPVIYAGQGVHFSKAWSQLLQLAESLGAPVTTSLEGKSAFPEEHPLALGSGGRALPAPVHEFLSEADVIFGIGCSFGVTAFGTYIPRYKQAKIVHSTLDPKDLGRDIRADYALLGDAKLTLMALLDALEDEDLGAVDARRTRVISQISASRERWLTRWRPKLRSEEVPLSPYRVLDDLQATVDRSRTIITHDAGSPRDQLSPFWCSKEPLSYLGWGKTTQLGYGLGLAMGAKLARPDQLCINVWGDAAIGFTGMDFETAVRERIPILSILLNNFSMAIEIPIMKTAQAKFGSTDISGNYSEMARAFGGYGERVERPEDIVPAIRRGIRATEAGQPALLEFITAKEIEISNPVLDNS